VESVLQELGLTKVANTPVGNAKIRGISGGERKRTAIAQELVSDNTLIFLDGTPSFFLSSFVCCIGTGGLKKKNVSQSEPTSGLDAFTAFNIMELLLQLSKNGRTIISTIHQPRSNIYSLFNMLLLLSEGEVRLIFQFDF
jgi:ABC-type multidrug transport system ATPase subunit